MADLRKGYWVELLPMERTTGELALSFIAKRTYVVPEDAAVIAPMEDEEQPPFLGEDRYDDGDAQTAPPTVEAELVGEKGACDVIVVGSAYAPGGKPLPEFQCSIRVGERRRTLKILGPRKTIWVPPRKRQGKPVPQLPRFSDPEPVASVPLSYTRAYGGRTRVIFDPETLRITREVNAVMEAEAAERKEKKAKAAQDEAEAEQQARKEAEEQALLEARVGAVGGDDEKLLRGDGSFGYDDEGVRLHDGRWGDRTSRDGTAILDLEALEKWQQEQDQKEQAATRAVAEEKPDKRDRMRRNAAGEYIEVDDGVELLTEDKLAEELEKGAEEQEEMRRAWAEAAEQRRREEVLQGEGTRMLDLSGAGLAADDDRWEKELHAELKDADVEAEKERLAAIRERRKKLEEKLAEHPELPCPTNPFGKGFIVSHVKALIDRLELPQIEDPAAPLTPADLIQDFQALERVPLPAGFSTYPRHARPRIDRAGAYPSDLANWKAVQEEQKRALDLENEDDVAALREMDKRQEPGSMDPLYFNSASPTLHWARLDGDEEVLLENLTKDGALYFKLPGKAVQAELDRGAGVERQDLELDTVVIEPDERKVTLLWRTHFPMASWEELGAYPHMVGWVLDLDVGDKRRRDWEEAAAGARGDGTRILDPGEIEKGEEYWRTISDERKAAEAAAMAAAGGTAALDIERMGLYRQDDGDEWIKEAGDGTVDLSELEKKAKEDEEYLEKKQAALKALEEKEKKEDERREEVAEAIKEGKPVPPPDHKKSAKELKAKAAKKAAAAKKAKAAGGKAKAAGGKAKVAGGKAKAAEG